MILAGTLCQTFLDNNKRKLLIPKDIIFTKDIHAMNTVRDTVSLHISSPPGHVSGFYQTIEDVIPKRLVSREEILTKLNSYH